jgi:DNA-binding transcriptional ArsR family regulator
MNDSLFKPHDQRVRVTPATKRRDDNVRQIIAALRNGPMLKDDIRDMLGVSQSGINKYLQLLRHAGVIEIERYIDVTRFSIGRAVYRLSRDADLVDVYLHSLAESAKQVAPKDPTRHIHRLEDEGPWPDRLPKPGIPAPDPLLAAFFGMSQAAAQ